MQSLRQSELFNAPDVILSLLQVVRDGEGEVR